MLLHKDPLFSIYFGDERDEVPIATYSNCPEKLLESELFCKIKKALNVETIIVLHQVHGDEGFTIHSMDEAEQAIPFAQQRDYLITKVRKVGIAVVAADCLPLILYDKVTGTIGIAHAGWRGSVAGIGTKMLQVMKTEHGTNPEHVRLFFGPSAKICCNKVDGEFVKELEKFWFLDSVVRRVNGDIYFNLPLFNELQLIDEGIKKENIVRTYNECTICDESFCSSVRQGANAGRQMTVVALH